MDTCESDLIRVYDALNAIKSDTSVIHSQLAEIKARQDIYFSTLNWLAGIGIVSMIACLGFFLAKEFTPKETNKNSVTQKDQISCLK